MSKARKRRMTYKLLKEIEDAIRDLQRRVDYLEDKAGIYRSLDGW